MFERRTLKPRHLSTVGAVIGLLILVFASRIIGLSQIPMTDDETHLALRAIGTPAQVIQRQPSDWPPGFNLLVSFWMAGVGRLPFALQTLSILLFLPGIALTYRVAYRLFTSKRAAWTAALVYAALGYSVYLSTYVRAYALVMTLFPLALLLTLDYFERPGWRRALPLALTLAGMFYATYTAFFVFAVLGLYTVLTAPRAVWQWWRPVAILIPLALPELARRSDTFLGRVSDTETNAIPLSELVERTLRDIPGDYVGQYGAIWLVLGLIALALMIRSGWKSPALHVWLVLGVVLGPLALAFAVNQSIFLYLTARYTWWVLLMLALALGYGLSRLPRVAWIACAVFMVYAMFSLSVAERYKAEYNADIPTSFRWLQQHIQPGDVMVIDPNFDIAHDVLNGAIWAYCFDAYFDNRLAVVSDPGDHRRVWYAKQDGWHDEAFEDALLAHRVATEFVGPWNLLIRLYEAPPDPQGMAFDNGLRFHGFDILDGDAIVHPLYDFTEYDTVRMRLWWSVDHTLEQDYSISVRFQVGESLVAQSDSAPQLVRLNPADYTPLPTGTSQWEPGHYYIEERSIRVPDLRRTSAAAIMLTVYQWWDGVRIQAPGVDDDGLLPLTDAMIWAWN